MWIKLAEYFWFLGLLTVKQISRRTKLYLAKNIAVAVTLLAFVLLGVFFTSFAKLALVIVGVFLGPLMLGRVWAGVGTADIAQELLPEAKKDETITIKYITMGAAVILFCIAPLLIPILWPAEVVVYRSQYYLVLMCWIVLGYTRLAVKQEKGAKK